MKIDCYWLRLFYQLCCIVVILVWVSGCIMTITSTVVNSLNVYDIKQWVLNISTKHFVVSYAIYFVMTLPI